MKQTITATLILIILVLAGCSSEDVIKEDDMPEGDILPLEIGNKWVLQAPGTLIMNFEVTDFEDDVYELSYRENTVEPIYYYIEKKEGNYYLLKETYDTELTVYEPALLIFKDDFEVGDMWIKHPLVTTTDEYYEDWEESATETITVRIDKIEEFEEGACYYITRESREPEFEGYGFSNFCLRPGVGIIYHEFGVAGGSFNMVSMATVKEATIGGETVR